MKQASFLPSIRIEHGGSVREGKRKTARPFSHKHAMHVVLRASRARGRWSLLATENEARVETLLRHCAGKYRIQVYRSVNVGNHLHLLVKTKSASYLRAKDDFKGFLREFAGAVAFQITGARKANAKGRFWDKTLYSRILSWGREFTKVAEYFTKNFLESKGLWSGTWDPFASVLTRAATGPPG